ncbi:MAG: 4-hydroxythreonine-4-phosphate dehydrogenase PdxA [Bacteroidota bacterium]|jgi:4-hydroxythreonine-4-phosphate dehydrogenase
MSVPEIVITCGDVNGIGLRCLAMALETLTSDVQLRLAIAPEVLRSCIEHYQLPGTLFDLTWQIGRHMVDIEPVGDQFTITPGQPSDEASHLAIASLEHAFARVRSGMADATVTLPINKHALQKVGWPYPGQTEMVAAYAAGDPLMVLCTRSLHVALATVHIPLQAVAATLNPALIEHRIIQLAQHLHDRFGIDKPRIAVLGLNPHAGEHGQIGHEDDEIIRPAIVSAREQGINVSGPFPADGFFGFGAYEQFDGVLAMYHDQGLIPLKLLAKGAGVNVTAGLSIIRTSPDHGTAYDRIRSADIDSASTRLAIEMAIEMASRPHALT